MDAPAFLLETERLGLRPYTVDDLDDLPLVLSRRVAEKIGMMVDREVAYGSMGWPHLVYAIHREAGVG